MGTLAGEVRVSEVAQCFEPQLDELSHARVASFAFQSCILDRQLHAVDGAQRVFTALGAAIIIGFAIGDEDEWLLLGGCHRLFGTSKGAGAQNDYAEEIAESDGEEDFCFY